MKTVHGVIRPPLENSRPLVLHTRCVAGHGGGPEKTILNSPRYLRRFGYDSVCAYMHPPVDPGWGTLCSRAAERDAELLSIPDRGAWDWKVLSQLVKCCRGRKVAIWHGHDYKSNALGLAVNRFWPMKLVTTVHGWVQHTWRTPLYYAIDKACLRHYDQVICVSEDLFQTCRNLGIPSNRCHQIENAIDIDEFRRPSGPVSASVQSDRPLVIGAMGRLSEEKGFGLLIRAVDELLSEGRSLELLIAGDGHLRASLQGLIGELGRNAEIRLVGQVEDPKEYFLGLDVFVLSSLREGLPNVLLESMALGVPVIATRVAGIPRLIEHDQHGWLIEPGTVAALVGGVRHWATLDDYGRRWAARARERVEQSFSFHRRMERVVAVYDELLL